MAETSEITYNYFFEEFRKKVSASNARLLLQTAVVRAGIHYEADTPMNKEDARTLCMELIKTGGPGFHVGRAVYNQMTR